MRATAEARANIAVVKYWGQRNGKLMLPFNSSLSVTMDGLVTRTTVEFSRKFSKDRFILNGSSILDETQRVSRLLNLLRGSKGPGARITSKNYFPTKAGLASSSSGFAALAVAAAAALGLDGSAKQLSIIARQASGSACRSMLGGFVEWKKGVLPNGRDSFSVQVADEEHWPELRNIVAIVDSGRKKVGSMAGMRMTAKTSSLFPSRVASVPSRITRLKQAIARKDFKTFAEVAMEESNSMHAVMLDTKPPLVYLNDTSKAIMAAVEEFNKENIRAGYSFDAGPNAHVFTEKKYVTSVQRLLASIDGVKELLVCRPGAGPKVLEVD